MVCISEEHDSGRGAWALIIGRGMCIAEGANNADLELKAKCSGGDDKFIAICVRAAHCMGPTNKALNDLDGVFVRLHRFADEV